MSGGNYALVVEEISRLRKEQELEQAQYETKLIFSDVIVHMNKKFSAGNRKPSEILEDSYITSAYKYISSFFY
jgi:hypothetical protein